MKIQKPFLGKFRITQKFGAIYKHLGKSYFHYGVDFACPRDTPLFAVADGEVSRAKNIYKPFSYGKEVRIDHGNFLSQYAHLNKIVVKVSQNVKAGDLVGYSGCTGFCIPRMACHLHFGIKANGKWIDSLPLFQKIPPKIPKKFKPTDKLVPIFRLYNPETRDHFCTISFVEANQAVKKYGYRNEGVLGFIHAAKK